MAASQSQSAIEAWGKWKLAVRKQLILKLRLRGPVKSILIGILDCQRDGKVCWPSDEWLAGWSGCCVKTVQRQRARLVDLGLIEMTPRFERGTGRQQSNYCWIVWQKVGRMSPTAPMAAWKKPDPLRQGRTVPLPPTVCRPRVALPPTSMSPLESNESKGNEKKPPTPTGWASALAAVGEVLNDQETRDRASSEARRHGLSSDDVLALVKFYRANASAFRSAGVLAYSLRNAKPGCVANPGEHFPMASLPPNASKKSSQDVLDETRVRLRYQRLTRCEIEQLVRDACDRDPSLNSLVEEFSAEQWAGFPREKYRKLLMDGIQAGVLAGVTA